jgi:DNA-binding GntR family transcriptional regulator
VNYFGGVALAGRQQQAPDPERQPSGGRPVYQVLAEALRAAILSGEYPPHRQLPTEAELAETHGVGRQTVRQAFGQLVTQGLVYRVRGRGTFATPVSRGSSAYLRSFGSVDELLALSTDTELRIVTPLHRRANIDAAARLQLDSDEVMEVTFQRLHHGEPFCVSTVDVPFWVGREIASAPWLAERGAQARETIIGLIEGSKTIGRIAGAQQSITSVATPLDVAPLIEREPGEPALRIDRVYFDRDGTRLELAVTYANPVRYAYRLELRRSDT